MHDLIPKASYYAMFIPIKLLLPPSGSRLNRWWAKVKRWWWMRPIVKKRIHCAKHGHILTRRAWIHEKTRKVGEYHCGCTTCDLFWTEEPYGFNRTSKPKYLFG